MKSSQRKNHGISEFTYGENIMISWWPLVRVSKHLYDNAIYNTKTISSYFATSASNGITSGGLCPTMIIPSRSYFSRAL